MDPFTPLENYGIVGNLETCALVSDTGSVDWCCFPHLESPSVFARLLDVDAGGHFSIRPSPPFEPVQSYVARTNVVETTFETPGGTVTLTDLMPVFEAGNGRVPKRALYRKSTCTEGSVTVDVDFRPRFDYARADTTVDVVDGDVLATSEPRTTPRGDDGSPERALLSADVDWEVTENGRRVTAILDLSAGDSRWFVLCYGDDDPIEGVTAERALEQTLDYWRGWTHTCNESECVFGGPWHDLVVRSGLVLKLLAHHGSGAIAAAPTTSLPETIGGVRNWDYRFNWIRDAAFTLQALSNLNHVREAEEYFEWFLDVATTERPDEIQPLYGLHGETELLERELPHLSGYRNSAPVRIGNEAADQRQLDTYGELVLAIYEMVRASGSIDRRTWTAVRDIVDFVADVWTEPDAGIWEIRSEPEHFVFSKVMCWAALDCAIDLATAYDRDADLDHWREERDLISEAVLDRGVEGNPAHFVRSFDSSFLDASTLLLPFVGFLPFDDPRIEATIEAVDERLATDDGLVHRYEGTDGLPGEEGTFALCSFWLINALTLTGRVAEARDRFERVLEYVSPLGLLAEEIDPTTGRQLGNFPQAFSHVGLVNTALYLGKAMGREEPGVEPLGTAVGSHAFITRDE